MAGTADLLADPECMRVLQARRESPRLRRRGTLRFRASYQEDAFIKKAAWQSGRGGWLASVVLGLGRPWPDRDVAQTFTLTSDSPPPGLGLLQAWSE
jgi:hypothetical protein